MSKAKNPVQEGSRTCVLVLGMHRSGTSALAGALSKLGCELPAHSMAASKSNARGFYESTEVRDFNDALLASAGSAWDDFAEFPANWSKSPIANEYVERAVALLEGEFGNAQLFVFKDPRICRLAPFWLKALERFGCVTKPISIVRNPLDVSRSLLTKRGFSEPTGEMLWLRHALDAERATRGMVRFHTSFEQLMVAWETVAIRAEDALGLVWPKPIANAEFEVAEFLSHDLRHHQDATSRVLVSPLLPSWLRETYEILKSWAEAGERPDDYRTLDQIGLEFDVASNAFARLARAEREASLEPRHRVRELEEEARLSAVASSELILQSKVQIAALQSSNEELIALRENERSSFEMALAEERSEILRLNHASEEQRILFEQLVEEQRIALATLENETKQRIEDLNQALQDQRRRNTLMAADLHQLDEERATLQAQLSDARSELAASRARRKEMAQVIARRDASIQARYQELAALERHLIQSSWSWKAKELWRKFSRVVRRPLQRSSFAKAA